MFDLCFNETYSTMETMTEEITVEILTESKTEIKTTMPLLDHDPIVQFLILSQHPGLAEEYRATTSMELWPRRTMYSRVGLYIYPINTILKMFH